MDFYPSDDFDGELENEELDFNPVLKSRVFLTEDGKVYADVYSDPDFDLSADTVVSILKQLADTNTFTNKNFNKNPNNYPPLPANFFIIALDVRGPFSDNEQVEKWLANSGLRKIAKVYYYAEADEFWIDVNTN